MPKTLVPSGYDTLTGQFVSYETGDSLDVSLAISDITGLSTALAGKLDLSGGTMTGNLTFSTGTAIRTNTAATNTLLFQAYNTTGASYTTFATLTAGTTPTFDLSDSTTKAGQYIYRASGTDVPVSDGGTGVSSLTAYAPLFGGTTSTGSVQSGTVGTAGHVLTSNGAGAIATFKNPTILPYTAKTAAYTATDNDYVIDCTTGAFAVTLPTAVGRTGKVFVIKRTGTGLITVVPNGSELIDGSTGVSINVRYTAITVQSTGTGWIII